MIQVARLEKSGEEAVYFTQPRDLLYNYETFFRLTQGRWACFDEKHTDRFGDNRNFPGYWWYGWLCLCSLPFQRTGCA